MMLLKGPRLARGMAWRVRATLTTSSAWVKLNPFRMVNNQGWKSPDFPLQVGVSSLGGLKLAQGWMLSWEGGGVGCNGGVSIDDVLCSLITGGEVGVVVGGEFQIGFQLEDELFG